MRVIWFTLVAVMSAINLVLFGAAALNLDWVLSRIGSGQYDSLPVLLRLLYLTFAVITIAQVRLAWRLLDRGGAWSHASAVASMLLVLAYVVSTVLNAISRSNDARWFAIPAFVLMLSFFMLRAPEDKPSV